VAKLYATFDSKMMSRTASDINLSFAATVSELAELPNRTINLAVAGMAYHLWGMDRASHTQPAERAELLLEHPEFVVWLDRLLTGVEDDRPSRQNSRHLQRQPVVAAMFGTWQKAKVPATTFWDAVRDETGALPTLPDRKLARYLLSVGVDKGAGVGRVRKAEPREFYVKSLHAWNAWRKSESTDLRYYADKEIPAIK
jgi:hypothetical protein